MDKIKNLLGANRRKLEFIKNLLKKNDPVGLIDGGAPDDEYDDEILKLISILDKCNSEEQLYKAMVNIFAGMSQIDHIICQKNAKTIWDKFISG